MAAILKSTDFLADSREVDDEGTANIAVGRGGFIPVMSISAGNGKVFRALDPYQIYVCSGANLLIQSVFVLLTANTPFWDPVERFADKSLIVLFIVISISFYFVDGCCIDR